MNIPGQHHPQPKISITQDQPFKTLDRHIWHNLKYAKSPSIWSGQPCIPSCQLLMRRVHHLHLQARLSGTCRSPGILGVAQFRGQADTCDASEPAESLHPAHSSGLVYYAAHWSPAKVLLMFERAKWQSRSVQGIEIAEFYGESLVPAQDHTHSGQQVR